MYAGIGAATFGFRPYAGMVLMRYSKERSEELIRAARHNPFIYKWLEYFANSSDTLNLILGHGIMLWAILHELGTLKGNPAIFQMAGLSVEQIMAPPPNMPEMTKEEMDVFTASINGRREN